MTNCPSCGSLLDSASPTCISCGTPLATSVLGTLVQPVSKSFKPNRFASGTIISNRYRVIEFIGRGGMGEVIRAEDQELDQIVALKFLSPKFMNDSLALERVRTEVRMARLVSHPNVCRVHDLNSIDGQSFISMEYIDGEDLAELLRRVGRLAGDRALEVAREICAGLAAAHAAGVIHRDLKPGNIMLDRNGHVKITDFGLAWTGGDGSTPGEIAGTPVYIAPEQIAGAGATIKSDIYALGLVLYELLTGRRVFFAATLSEMMRERREPIIPPTQIVREIDPSVEKIILQCLAKNPEQRPNSALEVLSALSGGDPLKAALAAGQTPSPSDVAASPARGMLKPSIAWLCMISILVALGLFIQVQWKTSLLGRIASPLKPEVLEAKAEEALRALEYRTSCAHDASGFTYNDDALRAAVNTKLDPLVRKAAEKQMILFWHRCSTIPIMPRVTYGEATLTDPPLTPGDAYAVLGLNGRLIEYKTLLNDQSSQKLNDALFNFVHLAGIDSAIQNGKSSIQAKLDGSIPVSIRHEVHEGILASAKVVPPWSMPEKDRKVEIMDGSDVTGLLVIILILASIPLAVHNLKSDRADSRGALRLGLLIFSCTLVTDFLFAHHESVFNYELTIFNFALSHALSRSLSVSFIYLALEPFVRRVWPENLVSWTRLLSGNWRDPMVARDIFIGTTVTWCIFGLQNLVKELSHSTELSILKQSLYPLFGLTKHIIATSEVIALSIRYGLMFLLLLLLIRIFSRIRWLTLSVLFLIVAGFMTSVLTTGSEINFFGTALAIIWTIAMVTILVRFGLLALIAAIFFLSLNGYLPDATRATEWAALSLWWQVGLTVVIAIYGLYFATGRKPFGERKLLEA